MEYYDWLQHFDQLEPCQSFPTSAELAVSLGASPISLASIPTQNAELAPSWTGCVSRTLSYQQRSYCSPCWLWLEGQGGEGGR